MIAKLLFRALIIYMRKQRLHFAKIEIDHLEIRTDDVMKMSKKCES